MPSKFPDSLRSATKCSKNEISLVTKSRSRAVKKDRMLLNTLLRQCLERHASDLHLSSGAPPLIRIHGNLVPLSDAHLTHHEIHRALTDIMAPQQQTQFNQSFESDFAIDVPHLSRFRVHAFHQARGASVAFRVISHRISSLEEIQAPIIFSKLIHQTQGLVLVTGPTGVGKSTTLAALLDAINQTQTKHIVTIENPIEFVHASKKSLIQQREVGTHTLSFANALRSVLREDPDVILVGELRDIESIRLALSAAETGHLVLATLHTASAAQTLERMVDVFPSDEKNIVRNMLSESLQAVVSQVLCKRLDGAGRVAAYEVMVPTSAVRHLIREGKVAQLYSTIQTGHAHGMNTLDQHLANLLHQGVIDATQASAFKRMHKL